MRMSSIVIASMILLLNGCSTMRVRIEIPASVKQACPVDLGPAPHHTFGDTDETLLEMYELYHTCAGAVHADEENKDGK